MFARYLFVTLATATLMASCDAVQAETILVDFNTTASTPTLGGTWNTIAAPSATTQSLYDTAGNLTSVSLATTGSFGDSSLTITGWSKSWVDTAASRDYFYLHGDSISGTVTFDGLDDSLRYNLEIVASRDSSSSSGKDIVDITVQSAYTTNEVSSNDFDCYNTGYLQKSILIWNNVAPSGGQIDLTYETQDATGYMFLNAAQLSTVPEPSTLLLLLGLAVGMIGPCRRRLARP